MKTGALYIRVSTHDQDELSPDAQVRLCMDYAKSNNIEVLNEHIFIESVSGRTAKNRQEFQRMIALAKDKSHPFDVIIVWKFSRFARNQEESIVYKSMLKKDNIEVVSVSEPLVEGPFGSLIERIIEWMDEYYSIRLSGEVSRGMTEKAIRGGYQVSPPTGYRAVGGGKPYEIDEDQYKIVQYIFDQYDLNNLDPTRIARNLNEMGYRTKRGTLFEIRTINRILSNPFYCGIVKWKDVEFDGLHEVRLTKERFEERMHKMAAKKQVSKKREVSSCLHWLSGVLKCGECGASLVYNRHKKGFQCWRYAKGVHKKSMYLSEEKVIEYVFAFFEDILDGKDFEYTYHSSKALELNTQRDLLEKELEQIALRERRIALSFEKGIDTLEEYAENKQRLKIARSDVERRIKELDVPTEQLSRDEMLRRIKNVYDLLLDSEISYEIKGNAIREIVDKIVYDKDAGELQFFLCFS